MTRPGFSRRLTFPSICVVLFSLLAAASPTRAQSIAFQGLTNSVTTFGATFWGVATDSSGNVYVAYNSAEVREVTPAGVATTISTQHSVSSLAVSTSGDIYYTDYSGGAAYKHASGGTETTVASGLNGPRGIAVDASGNVYIGDAGDGRVLKVAPGGAQSTVGSGYTRPEQVAVDSSGNVYVADSSGNHVVKVPWTGSAYGAQTTIGTGLSSPSGVAIDSSGNAFIANQGHAQIVKVTPGGVQTTFAATGGNPVQVATDSKGDVFYGDYAGNNLWELQLNAVNFGTAPVGANLYSGTSYELDFTFNSSVTVGGVSVVAQGITGEDFQNFSSISTCTAGSYTSGQSCTMVVALTPIAPGTRMGAIVFYDNASPANPLFTLFIYGTGVGPVISFAPPNQVTNLLPNGGWQASPMSVAVDAGGNVYFNDEGPDYVGSIFKMPWTGSSYSTPVKISGSFGFGIRIAGLAVDGAGNVIVGDNNVGRVVEIPWIGSAYGTPTVLQSTSQGVVGQVQGLTLDGQGNIYYTLVGSPTGAAYELPHTATGFGSPVKLSFSGLSQPGGIALDTTGNIYVSDEVKGTILQLPVAGTQVTVATGLTTGNGLAVDAAGNIYSDNGNSGVVEIPWNGSSWGSPASVFPSSFNVATNGIALDGNGNVYEVAGNPNQADENTQLSKLDRTDPPSLTFPNTNVGSASASQDVIVENLGNDKLQLAWISPSSPDFNLQGADTSCPVNGGWLAVAESCVLGIEFSPQSGGAISQGIWLEDNSMNHGIAYDGYNQVIPLSGFGGAAVTTPTVTTTAASAITQITATGGGVVTAAGSSNVTGRGVCWSTSANPTTAGTCASAGTGTGSFTAAITGLTANTLYHVRAYATNSSGTAYGTDMTFTTLSAGIPTISWSPTTPITYGTTLGSGDFAATASYNSTDISADGTFAYYVTSVGGTTATASTILPAGSQQLCVQWTPSSSYSAQYASTSLCVPITVNPAATTISWTPASPIISPATLGSGQFNASASAGSTNVSSNGTFTYYVGVVGGTVANSSTVLPVGSDQLCVMWSPSSSYSADYNSSQACANITVNGATSISWTPASPITYPATLGSAQFNAAALSGSTNIGADGTFTYYVGSVGGTTATSGTVLQGGADTLCVQWTPSSSYSSQYGVASLCAPITVNAASTATSWSPSTTTIIASTGPTAAQFDATTAAGTTNVTANGTMTYHLSTAGGTQISVGATLSVGPTTICAVWTPSSGYAADYNGSSTCQSFTVINTQPTATTLATNANPVFLSNSVTFTATVTPTSGSIVPTGTVTFYAGGTSIGTGSLSPSGTGASAIAKLTTTSLTACSNAMTANYPGDTNNQASQAVLTEVVEDFAIASTGSSSSTVEPGLAASFTFTVSPVSPATTFPAAITFVATGLPTGATATFSPTSIASGAGSTTFTLTVMTPITTLSRNQSPAQGTRWPLVVLALLLMPLASRFRRTGRRLSHMLSLLLLVAAGLTAAGALNGCGGVSSGYFGQAPATSSITVTGTSGSLNHTASVSLTVE
jgi:sugar lactone lactonase YvrE